MVRLMAILAILACAPLSGCTAHDEATANTAKTATLAHGTNLGTKESAPCLTGFGGNLSACMPGSAGQRRLVLIRNVVVPLEE